MKQGHRYPRAETLALHAEMIRLAGRPNGVGRGDFDRRPDTMAQHLKQLEREGRLISHTTLTLTKRYFKTEKARADFAEREAAAKAEKRRKTDTPRYGRAWWIGTAEENAKPRVTSATRITVAKAPADPTRTNTHSVFG